MLSSLIKKTVTFFVVWKVASFCSAVHFLILPSSVGDPDPNVFGPPGSESISQRYGSGSGVQTKDNVPVGEL